MADLHALIQRWIAGDEWAAEAIYNQHCRQVFGLAYSLLDNVADAEEVAQDALRYALTNIHRYDPQQARFGSWLYTITVSRCRNKRRRNYLPTFSLFSWLKDGDEVPADEPLLEHRAIQAATQDEIWQALQQLKPSLREAILLRHWADYTYQEIGDMVGCSMRTAQSRVRLAHKKLKAILAAETLNHVEEVVR